jgi:ketosteroid isomerase-like protein
MTNEEVVRRYFYCLDHEDWVQMRELWHDDGTLRAVGARPRDGIEDVMNLFGKLFVPWPKHCDEPTRIVHGGDTVLVEVTFTGTTGDGREVSFDAIDVFDLRDGKIGRMTNWYDTAYARKMLAAPAAAS